MSLAFFFIAVLLTGIFKVHGRVVGNMVLQEGLEQCVYAEELQWEEIGRESGEKLRSFFWCGNGRIRIENEKNRTAGWVKTAAETEITIKRCNPENFLRLLAAAGI